MVSLYFNNAYEIPVDRLPHYQERSLFREGDRLASARCYELFIECPVVVKDLDIYIFQIVFYKQVTFFDPALDLCFHTALNEFPEVPFRKI